MSPSNAFSIEPNLDPLIEIARAASDYLASESRFKTPFKALKKDRVFKQYAKQIKSHLNGYRTVHLASDQKSAVGQKRFKAVHWNIERGKSYQSILHVLKNHPQIKDADIYFLTEVDWGMARSYNMNIAAQLGNDFDLNAYFAPSYYNLTKGHGAEIDLPGQNELGLHGKAILSKYPLTNIRSVGMPNMTNPAKKRETRLGQKNALIADLEVLATEIQSLDGYGGHSCSY